MIEVAEDLWLLDGRPRYAINIYLAGTVLIDGGTRWARRRVLRQVSARPPRLMALTHGHPDHQGMAAIVCRKFGVPLACHEADVPAVEGREPMSPRNRFMRFGELFLAGPARRVDQPLRDGDVVEGFRVVHAPGHTLGHVIYFREHDRVVVAGDVLANQNLLTGEVRLAEPPPVFSVDRQLNRRSILRLAELRPSLVCFGHGPPLTDMSQLHAYAARLAAEL